MFKRSVFIFLMASLSYKGVALASTIPIDSVGLENRNGKTFVVHKVVPKETLFALSRRYNVPVNLIVEANPKIQSGLSIGQLVYIPRKLEVVSPAPAATAQLPTPTPQLATVPTVSTRTFVVDEKGNKIHEVVEKQTLFSISRLHQVSVADIKKWNKLTADGVSVGDKLIVGIDNKVAATPQYVPEVDDDIEKNKVVTAPAKPATPIKTPETPVIVTRTEKPTPPKTVPATEDNEEDNGSESITKVTEAGLAEIIDNRNDNNKYLALHKTAPIGTILQVKNSMNNQSVYVRVIGKLPETGANDRVIVKISKRAHQKLAAIDNRFRVEVSYMP